MDIRFTALDVEAMTEDAQPPELKEYTSKLRDLYVDLTAVLRRGLTLFGKFAQPRRGNRTA